MKTIKIGLLPRIIFAIILGIILGKMLPVSVMRIFATFNGIFSQFIGFLVPLLIIGFVTPAIAGVEKQAGKILVATVAVSYLDSVLSGLMSYGVSAFAFPQVIDANSTTAVLSREVNELKPYFPLTIKPPFEVMTSLVFSFMLGICVAMFKLENTKNLLNEFRIVIDKTLRGAMIPLLPVYIFGLFLDMSQSGRVSTGLGAFARVILIIFAMHVALLFLQFCIAGSIAKKNPIRMLINMMPSYFTALGTASSAATIPITMKSMEKNGVDERISGFVAPLCATIHMSGSEMKITACAVALMIMHGMPYNFSLFLGFCSLLGIFMIAGPGVPGGAIMAALGVLSSVLGFNDEMQALMIALYIAMDSFGTACNVTGDGAIAVIMDKFYRK
jgi:Na+/H+-dicarboxylate symporter